MMSISAWECSGWGEGGDEVITSKQLILNIYLLMDKARCSLDYLGFL